MEILRKSADYNIILNQNSDFQTNLGWEEGMDIFEEEVLDTIINPADNYETVRYIHEPYTFTNSGDTQCDIWFKFFFIDSNQRYDNGLDYNLVGISPKENALMTKQSTSSFFRLEFYKTPNDQPPTRLNRKFVFARNLSLPIGEKFYYTTLRQNIHVPVFMGSNYKNKENMYLFWFQDDSVLSDSTLSGDTFYMTAKFYNGSDGSIIDFTNSRLINTTEVSEYADLYYKVVINKTNYTYRIYQYDGEQNDRIGNGLSNSINFYQKGGEIGLTPTPTPPAPSPSPSAPLPTPPAATPEASPEGPIYFYFKLKSCMEDPNSPTNVYWTYRSFLSTSMVYGNLFKSAGGVYYTIVDHSLTDQGGTIDGSKSISPDPQVCSQVPNYWQPQAPDRTISISYFAPSTYKSQNDVKTEACGKNAFSLLTSGYTYVQGWIQESTITYNMGYQLYSNIISSDMTNATGPTGGKYCGITVNINNTPDSIIRYVAYVNSTGYISDWSACPS